MSHQYQPTFYYDWPSRNHGIPLEGGVFKYTPYEYYAGDQLHHQNTVFRDCEYVTHDNTHVRFLNASDIHLYDTSGIKIYDSGTLTMHTSASPDSRGFIVDQIGRVGIGMDHTEPHSNGVELPSFDLDVKGQVGIEDYIYHNDDVDTYMLFGSDLSAHNVNEDGSSNTIYPDDQDEINFFTGDVAMLQMRTRDYVFPASNQYVSDLYTSAIDTPEDQWGISSGTISTADIGPVSFEHTAEIVDTTPAGHKAYRATITIPEEFNTCLENPDGCEYTVNYNIVLPGHDDDGLPLSRTFTRAGTVDAQDHVTFNKYQSDVDFVVRSRTNTGAFVVSGDGAEVVINEDGNADTDFRVESDNSTKMLYVDTENEIVEIRGPANDDTDIFLIAGTGDDGEANHELLAISPTDTVFNESSNLINFRVESGTNQHALFIKGDGSEVVINDDGRSDTNFRVESAASEYVTEGHDPHEKSHALFVQTSTGRVGIGKSSPQTTLHVAGSAHIEGDLWVKGVTNQIDTLVHVTSAMDITNIGTGPALEVTQTGAQPIASFYDDNVPAMYIEDGGEIGMGTSTPGGRIHVWDTSANNSQSLGLILSNYHYQNSGTNKGQSVAIEGRVKSAGGGDVSTAKLVFGKDSNYSTTNHYDGNLQFQVMQGDNAVAQLVERMRIISNGNVGIGTDAPETLLDLNSNTASENVLITFSKAGTGEARIGLAGATSAVLAGSLKDDLCIRSDGNNIRFGTASATRTDMTIDSAGDVGIGTTTPSKKLEIVGAYDSMFMLVRKEDQNQRMEIHAGAGTVKFKGIDKGNNQDVRFVFETQKGNTVSEKMRIENNGNVGIGTGPNPEEKLDVRGTIKTKNDSDNSEIKLVSSGGTPYINIKRANVADWKIKSTGNGSHQILTTSFGTTDLMTVQGNGNVGIGTTSPVTDFEVKASGNSWAGGLKLTDHDDDDGWIFHPDASSAGLMIGEVVKSDPDSGSARLTINKGGNIGIGTTGPVSKTTIENGHLAITQSANTTQENILLQGAGYRLTNGTLYGNVSIRSNYNASSNAGSLNFYTAPSSTTTTERMRIQPDGRVGIGETAPDSILHIKGTSPTITLEDTTGSGATHHQSQLSTDDSSGALHLMADTNAKKNDSFISFRIDGTGTSHEKMRVDHSGSVGIATTNFTDAPLSIAGINSTNAPANYGYIRLMNEDTTSVDGTPHGGIFFVGKQPDASLETGSAIKSFGAAAAANSNNNMPSDLVFYTNPGGTGGQQARMYIGADGNIGIGNSAPGTYKLNISGNLYVNGNIHASEEIDAQQLTLKSDTGTADHIVFYDGSTRVGEIGCQDTTWLRINQETAKNIFTPRMIRADGGFNVDNITVVDGNANIIGERVTGTVPNADKVDNLHASSFARSDADDTVTGLLTLSPVDPPMNRFNECLRLSGNGSTTSPYLTFCQSGTRRALIQYLDTGDKLRLMKVTDDPDEDRSAYVDIGLGTSGLKFTQDGQTGTVWHSRNHGNNSGLDADKLDGLHASNFLRSGQNIVVGTNSSSVEGGEVELTCTSGVSGYSMDTFKDVNGIYGHGSNEWLWRVFQNGSSEILTYSASSGDLSTTGDLKADALYIKGHGNIEYSEAVGMVIPGQNIDRYMAIYRPGTQNTKQTAAAGIYLGQDGNNYYDVMDGDTHTFRCNRADGNLADLQSASNSFGVFRVRGDVIAFHDFSDKRLKKNITTIDSSDALDKILNLQGVTYEWRDDSGQAKGTQIGLVAQDVEQHVPQVVSESSRIGSDEQYKRVDYDKLVPMLIESIKLQQAQIAELTHKVEQLSK